MSKPKASKPAGLRNLITSLRNLGERVVRLEGEVAMCLRFIRFYAEKMAKEQDPSFKVSSIDYVN